MKKEFVGRIGVGLLGGIAVSYLITVGISITLGDGNYYPCVPGLVEQFGSEIMAVIIQTILSALLGAGFAGTERRLKLLRDILRYFCSGVAHPICYLEETYLETECENS